MAQSFLLIGGVVMSLFCTRIADSASLNYDHDLTKFLQMNDIVINTANEFLQEEEKRLATLKKHIEDYRKEHEEAIRKMSLNCSVATQETSVNDENKVKEADKKADVLHTPIYADKEHIRLCRGDTLLPADIQKKLKCRYIDRGVPFLKIAPFKEEEVYVDPKIVVYHDVIYEEEIENIKSLSEPMLKSAQIFNKITGKLEHSKARVTKIAFIKDEKNKHVKLLSRRVEHITGLTVDTAEQLQIGYYEIGGFYQPHFDFATKDIVSPFSARVGNRLATILFYMNDVTKGGGTIFPTLNFTVWPKKGSALFWYNLKRNGEGDLSTFHAACPVLSGTKWIATKWLHEVGQEFRRPCTLLEYE
ncbi:prolyl 4-hydroxylase subunit alpha-1-like [Belonocnema kinseyi]|uniref:prolyl 4-hydroxylase subunit alpha-1-like n=1 Tax=Belonocnema kinseyi TaxID=2817044 RepID=UPI00143D9B3D|nr:prolyl 4-hydroxylase subunit alpha-1-like [Belonocnema kinseyi]